MKTKIFLGIIPLIFGIVLSSCSDSGTEPTKESQSLMPLKIGNVWHYQVYRAYKSGGFWGDTTFSMNIRIDSIDDLGFFVLNTDIYDNYSDRNLEYGRFMYDVNGNIIDKWGKLIDKENLSFLKEETYLYWLDKETYKKGVGLTSFEEYKITKATNDTTLNERYTLLSYELK